MDNTTPVAGKWAVIKTGGTYSADVRKIDRVTPKLLKLGGVWKYPKQVPHADAYACFDSQAEAEALRAKIAGIRGEFTKRSRSAHADYLARVDAAKAAGDAQLARAIADVLLPDATRS